MTSLAQAPLNSRLTLLPSDDTPELRLRLHALGFRAGASVCVVQKTVGGGRIVSVAGARVAVGRELAESLLVEVGSGE